MQNSLSIVFLGTPEFAVTSLEVLLKNQVEIKAVVTVPDKPAGRGQKIISSPVKKFADGHNLRILQPANLKDKDFINELSSFKADLFIVVAFRMLPEEVWQMPPLGTFNLHASLLPQYRGAAPINWAIINGENETGVTTFFLRHEIDTGNIIFNEKVSIAKDETASELHDRLKQTGAELVLKTVTAISQGNVHTLQQADLIKGDLKPAPKLNKANTAIDIHKSPEEVRNLIRGLNASPGAHTQLNSSTGISFSVKIFSANAFTKEHGFVPGKIETDNKTYLRIYLRKGYIDVNELQLSGRNRISIRDFLNGVRLDGDWTIG
jgi:methionyl-tRNA formyltransferase